MNLIDTMLSRLAGARPKTAGGNARGTSMGPRRRTAARILGAGARSELLELLASLIGDGVKQADALYQLERLYIDQKGAGSRIVRAIRSWRRGTAAGQPLARAAAGDLGAAEIVILQSGESIGQLRAAAKIAGQSNRFYLAAGLALLPGLEIVFMTLAYMWFNILWIIPAIGDVKNLDQTSDMAFIANNGVSITIATGVLPFSIILAFLLSCPRWTGRLRVRLDACLPYSAYRRTQAGPWIMAVAAMIDAGMQPLEALRRLRPSCTPWLAERIDAISQKMRRSNLSFGRAIEAAGMNFPDNVLNSRLSVLAQRDRFPQTLRQLGEEFAREAEESLFSKLNTAGSILMFVLAVPLGWLLWVLNVAMNDLDKLVPQL